MIRAVQTAQEAAFLTAAAPWPGWRALLGRDLTLWAGNPGAPVKLFSLTPKNGPPTAVLALNGSTARLFGTVDDAAQREELAAFLRFTGTVRLRTPLPLAPWAGAEGEPLFCYALPADGALSARPLPAGCVLDETPPIAEVADLLFPQLPARRDAWYVAASAARNHGLARTWLLRDAAGTPLSTVSAGALWSGEAYLDMGYTAPAARGRGYFAPLIVHAANTLAGQGNAVALDCAGGLCGLYERLGFTQTGILRQYNTNCIQ